MNASLPVVVIGAGPVGLAAAAHLLERGLEPRVFEAGDRVGAGMRRWAHVRMFSPWEYAVDRASAALLARRGWVAPDPARLPTGGEVVERYLEPLAATPELVPRIRFGARVVAVSKQRRDRMKNANRDQVPYVVRWEDAEGEHEMLARAVIDASGTIDSPNPLGAAGIPALGERALHARIAYGLPDVLGSARTRYAGKRVLVVGSGHSAFNVLNDLAQLRREAPDTTIQWALRRPSLRRVLGGGANDRLQARGRLGTAVGQLVEAGAVQAATGFHLDALRDTVDGLVACDGERQLPPVDEIVAATGFRPAFSMLSELRLDLDAGTQSPRALAPLIDPNLHSCGTVRPHGADVLAHPDAGLYVVGMKSYGRAPTFLLLTGYEQVRSVVAMIDGDIEGARRVELVLPETGVCITDFDEDTFADGTIAATAAPAAGGCCGGPARADASACCVRDEVAKAEGRAGCGCASAPVAPVSESGGRTGGGCC
jgi:thioredoxin reductase